MNILRISTDLDCRIDNLAGISTLRCGNNYIERPLVSQLIFISIEYPDLIIIETLTPYIETLTINFSPLIREKNQKNSGIVITKTKDPWKFYGLYNINQNKEILSPEYDKVGDGIRFAIENDYLEIRNNESGNWGVITRHGEEIFPCQFLDINRITEGGLAVVQTKKGKTFVNAKEGLIFPVRSDYYIGYAFEDGLLRIKQNNKVGYINQYGQMIFNPIFDLDRINWYNNDFANGYSWEKKNEKWGIIDINGNVTCDFIFDYPGSAFDINKVSTLTLDNKLYFVSPNGDMEYRDAERGYYGGESVYIVKKSTGWGFQNFKGESLYFEAVFDKIIGFDEGVCLVVYQGREGFVTKEGKYFDSSSLNFDSISRFNSGRARIIRKNNGSEYVNVGYIDYNGKIVIDTVYHGYLASDFQNGIARVERYDLNNSKHKILSAYIDIYGNILCDYEVKELPGDPIDRFCVNKTKR